MSPLFQPGDLALTNLSQPGALVGVLPAGPFMAHEEPTSRRPRAGAIIPSFPDVFVTFLEPHPYGYPAGDLGWYRSSDLLPVALRDLRGVRLLEALLWRIHGRRRR